MRILICHSFYRLTGGEDRYVNQQAELLSADHTVEILRRDNADLTGRLAPTKRMIFDRRQTSEVESIVSSFAPDVIHVHNTYPSLGPAVHLVAERSQIPLVMTVHNNRLRCPNGLTFTEGEACFRCVGGNTLHAIVHDCFPTKTQAAGYAAAVWFHRFGIHLEEKVRIFITPSEFMATRLTEWGISRRKIETVRNFTLMPPTSSELGSAGCYVGRLVPEKGLRTLLSALAMADDPPFSIIGDGPQRHELEVEAARLKLSNLRFTGHLEQAAVHTALAGSRYMVIPSLWDENAPIAALEALVAGRPLLVSDKGGLPELATADRGLVVRAGDAGALARQIRLLATDEGEARRLAQGAARFAHSHLMPYQHARRLESVYALAVNGSDRRT